MRDPQSLSPARYALQLGSQIRELRRARHWTQKHLSSRIEVSESQMSKYEAGANSPHPLTLTRLAVAFGLPVDAVLPEVADVPADPVERELHGYLRQLVALPSREKETATSLLRIFLGFRELLLAQANAGGKR
jgi:transcriptional regulator with XRE-family HTH domain